MSPEVETIKMVNLLLFNLWYFIWWKTLWIFTGKRNFEKISSTFWEKRNFVQLFYLFFTCLDITWQKCASNHILNSLNINNNINKEIQTHFLLLKYIVNGSSKQIKWYIITNFNFLYYIFQCIQFIRETFEPRCQNLEY